MFTYMRPLEMAQQRPTPTATTAVTARTVTTAVETAIPTASEDPSLCSTIVVGVSVAGSGVVFGESVAGVDDCEGEGMAVDGVGDDGCSL